jgi:hypothetical protein
VVVPPVPTSGPVKQALVRKLKANSQIKTAAVGGIHEGLNASDVIAYPYVTFSLAFAPLERVWGSVLFVVGFDIVVRGPNPVEVSNLDVLITEELDDSSLSVTGLSTLTVHRAAELPLSPDRNAEGRRVFQNGGTYEIWLDKDRTPVEP